MLMTFVAFALWHLLLMTFVAYDICRIMTFVGYDVCRIMMFVGYDVCPIMMFVAYDIFECVTYRVCRSATNLYTPILSYSKI